MKPSAIKAYGRALVGYAATAALFNWPISANLRTRTFGPVGSDLGVYIWNIWVFRHEILEHHRFPLFTREVLSLTPPVDLSLHNYTLFTDMLAFPLIPVLGVVATFNLLYLLLMVLTAIAMFGLARSVIGRDAEAWLAGLLFAFSPVLITRSIAHSSLVIAAPLPVFLLCLIRTERRGEARYAVATGLSIAWASMCDAYYGIFCLLIGASYLAARWLRLRFAHPAARSSRHLRLLDATIVGLGVVAAVIVGTGGTEVRALGASISMRSAYSPVLLATVLFLVRLSLAHCPRLEWRHSPPMPLVARLATIGGSAFLIALSPVLYALALRLRDGGILHRPTFWRSSPPGIDALALIMPNPNHAWFGNPWRVWLTHQPNGYVENVASLTLVGIAVVAVAMWRYRFRPPRIWTGQTIFFAALSFGPFVHVGGFNTFIPGPWALLRYVPVITATNTPARYAVVLMMAFSMMFGLALAHIGRRHPAARKTMLAVVGAALMFELAPVPRQTGSTRVPEVYQIVASDQRNVRVMELPFGIRDGEGSEGDFSSASLFYQTFHQKPLIGGYLSRVSPTEIQRQKEFPLVDQLIRLSEGRPIDRLPVDELRRRGQRFVEVALLGYVVIDTLRTPPVLRAFATEGLGLAKIAEGDGLELYVPTIGSRETAVSRARESP